MKTLRFLLMIALVSSVHLLWATDYSTAAKCQLKKYENTIWYGEFKFYTGTTFSAVMYIDEVKNCELTGRFHWPDYFNTKTEFSGTFEDNKLQVKETRIYQGKINNLDNGAYEINLAGYDTLSGIAFHMGEEVASMQLYNSASLPEESLGTYQQKIADFEEKYGKLTVLEESAITLEALLENIQENSKEMNSDIKVKGTGIFSGFELPLTFLISKDGQMYMEMDFMGNAFRMGKNDSINWTYDPTTDAVEVSSIASDEDGMNPFEDNFGNNWLEDLDIAEITDTEVDGLPAYRVAYKDGDDLHAVYYWKSNYQVARTEKGWQVREYLDYKTFEEVQFFTTYRDMEPGGTVNSMNLEEITFVEQLDKSQFDIPEELISKVKQEEKSTLPDVARAAFDNEEYERSIELYTQLIRQSAYDHQSYYMRGRARYTLGEYYKAMGDMERAIELDEQYADYHNYRGLIKYALSDYKESLVDFDRTIALDSTGYIGYLNYAFAAFQLEAYDSAVTYLNKGIEFNPENGQLILNRGIIHYQLNQFQASLNDYKKVLELEYGDRGETVNRIGVAFYGLTQYDSAIVYFQEAVNLSPDNFQRQKNLGDAYYKVDDYDQAIATYLKARDLSEEPNATLLNDLAMSYYHSQDYRTALSILDQLIEVNGENATYYDNRAYTHSAVMDYQNAIKDFSRSIDLYSTDKEIYYQRGLLYKIQNNRFDACRDFQTAAEMEHEKAATELTEYCSMELKDSDN